MTHTIRTVPWFDLAGILATTGDQTGRNSHEFRDDFRPEIAPGRGALRRT